MTTDSGRGGITFNSMAHAGSRYEVKTDRGNWPINYVAWWDAIRFVNWLYNGQGDGNTETGACDVGPLNSQSEPIGNGAGISRKPDATWFLPTDNQWYKAAFHKNDGVTANYWDYHYGSDSPPTAEVPPGGSNSANLSFAVGKLSDVGAYHESKGPYGTFDQLGNVEEWTETLILTQTSARRTSLGGWRGGFVNAPNAFQSINASLTQDDIGFRIAHVIPEPSALLLAAWGCAAVLTRRRRFALLKTNWRFFSPANAGGHRPELGWLLR